MPSFPMKVYILLLASTSLTLILGGMSSELHAQSGTLRLISAAFQDQGTIPTKYTCDGQDISPALSWTGAPNETKSFTLIMDDPDARPNTWVHWVIYDLPASAHGLPENVPKQKELASGARNGVNGEPKIGYEGPCPPPGPEHFYHFKLYALDAKLSLKPGATKSELEQAMKGRVLGEAQLRGRYGRKQ